MNARDLLTARIFAYDLTICSHIFDSIDVAEEWAASQLADIAGHDGAYAEILTATGGQVAYIEGEAA